MKKIILAANWKMNNTPSESVKYVKTIKKSIKNANDRVIIFAPYLSLERLLKLNVKGLSIGAQNMHFADKGTFTGEISGAMLKDIGVNYVLIGHSERRAMFGETDDIINKKLKTATENGFKVMLCIGETYEEKENNITTKVLKDQIKKALNGVRADSNNLIVAYEPVWAISSGDPNKPKLTPTAKEIEKTHKIIKAELEKLGYSDIKVLYGGSANDKNCKEFSEIEGVDGFLIGGASLVKEKFEKMIELTNNK